jgi:hypothetical protein
MWTSQPAPQARKALRDLKARRDHKDQWGFPAHQEPPDHKGLQDLKV